MKYPLKSLLWGLLVTCFLWGTQTVAFASEYEPYNPTTQQENTDGFSKLQSINPEVRGWINVYGTQIDYPLLQTEDNKKYLDHNALGDYVVTGSIFMDYRCNPDFNDFNTIIYGHHVPSGVMFGEIKKFTDQAFFDSHKYGSIFYDGKEKGLEIFGILEVDAYDTQIYHTVGENEAEDQAYYQYLLSKAKYKRDVAVSASDKIVLLSTCFVDVTNGRHILLAKITDTVHKDRFQGAASNPQKAVLLGSFDFGAIPKWVVYLLVFVLLILVIILSIIVLVLLKRTKKATAGEQVDKVIEKVD